MKASDSSPQCSHLCGNVKSFMASCAAFGKRLPNCSCFCIDSAQRGKASLQLACGFIDHQVPPQLSPSRPHPLYFRSRRWGKHLFPPLKGWAGHFDRALFQPTHAKVSVFSNQTPCSSCIPISVSEGLGRREILPQMDRRTRYPASYLLRASRRPQKPTRLQSLGRGEFQDT